MEDKDVYYDEFRVGLKSKYIKKDKVTNSFVDNISIIISSSVIIFIIYFTYLLIVNFFFEFTIFSFFIFSVIIGVTYQIVGFYSQEYYNKHQHTCDVKPIDFWSMGHLLFHICISSFILLIDSNIFINIILNLGISLLWELFERVLYDKKRDYHYYCESITNSVNDIVFGLLGMVLTLAIYFYFY